MRHIQLAVERVVFFAVSEAEPTTRSVVLDALTSKYGFLRVNKNELLNLH